MTQVVSDETLAKFACNQSDWFYQVRNGLLCPEKIVEAVYQMIGEGFPVLKTITLGIGPSSSKGFHEALKSAHYGIEAQNEDILDVFDKCSFTKRAEAYEVDLVAVTSIDLGFQISATETEIKKRGKEYGLIPCPAEVGPQLGLQYLDQPMGEQVSIAMDPVMGSSGKHSYHFRVAKDWECGPWFYCDFSTERLFDEHYRWVFVRPRKTELVQLEK